MNTKMPSPLCSSTPRSIILTSLLALCLAACQPGEGEHLSPDHQDDAPACTTSSCEPLPDDGKGEEEDPNVQDPEQSTPLAIALTPSSATSTTTPSFSLDLEILAGKLDTLSISIHDAIVYTLPQSRVYTKGDTLSIPLTLTPGENRISLEASFSEDDDHTVTRDLLITYTPQAQAPTLTLDTTTFPLQTWEATLPFSAQVIAATEPTLQVDGEELSSITVTRADFDDNLWQLEGSLPLQPGQHTYSLTALADAIQSEPASITIERLVDDIPPTIHTTSHFDQQDTLTRQITIAGTIDEENALLDATFSYQGSSPAPLTVLEDGTFSFELSQLQPGQNLIAIEATDLAGNLTTFQLNLHYGSRLAAGGAHSAALFEDHLYTFGRNNKGQLGLGHTSRLGDEQHPTSPQLIAPTQRFVSIAFSQNASLALDVTGQVYAWGDNDEGQLGLGDASTVEFDDADRLEPTAISSIQDAVAIARGYDHGMILRADGTVWTFGDNGSGQLGHSDGTSSDVPRQVTSLSQIVQVVAGSKSSYALDAQGVVYGWGSNRYGNLGLGASDDDAHEQPATIDTLPPIAMLAAGRDHMLALSKQGELFVWGLNASTQVGAKMPLGDEVHAPIQREDIHDIIAIYAQANQSFILKADGKLYGWGQNLNGTLGIAAEENVDTPVDPVFGLLDVRGVAIGALHGMARSASHEVFAWGWSFEGSLGGGEEMIDRWAYRVPLLVDLPYAPTP